VISALARTAATAARRGDDRRRPSLYADGYSIE
jgi:hypothetical protein